MSSPAKKQNVARRFRKAISVLNGPALNKIGVLGLAALAGMGSAKLSEKKISRIMIENVNRSHTVLEARKENPRLSDLMHFYPKLNSNYHPKTSTPASGTIEWAAREIATRIRSNQTEMNTIRKSLEERFGIVTPEVVYLLTVNETINLLTPQRKKEVMAIAEEYRQALPRQKDRMIEQAESDSRTMSIFTGLVAGMIVGMALRKRYQLN